MKYITVREFRSSTAKMWRQLRKERQLCITSRGKPVAMITSTTENEVGDAIRQEQGRKALAALKEMQASAKTNGLSGMSMSQIDEIIAEARRERRLKK